MRLGILGGTFDPIHLGHLLIGEVSRAALRLDKVLFVPAGDPPHKQEQRKSSAQHRRRIVELAIADNAAFELSPVDLERPGPHYSVDTIRLIREQHNVAADDCLFLIGGDSLQDLPSWHKPEEIIGLCRLGVAHRPGFGPDVAELAQQFPRLESRLDWIEMPLIEISGTEIRERVKNGQSVRYQTPDEVIAYIEKNRLYR